MFLVILSTKKYETIYSVLFLNQVHTRQINILLKFRLNLSSPKSNLGIVIKLLEDWMRNTNLGDKRLRGGLLDPSKG